MDIQAGFCTCKAGRLGSFCKHQIAILHFFGPSCTNAPAASAEARLSMAKLAFGDNVRPMSFYEPFVAQPSTSSGIVTESEEMIPQQNILIPDNVNNNEEKKTFSFTRNDQKL